MTFKYGLKRCLWISCGFIVCLEVLSICYEEPKLIQRILNATNTSVRVYKSASISSSQIDNQSTSPYSIQKDYQSTSIQIDNQSASPYIIQKDYQSTSIQIDYQSTSPSSIQTYLSTSPDRTSDPYGLPNEHCPHRLGLTPAEDLAKIAALKFDGIHQYLDGLFPPLTRDPQPSSLPVFVTAMSSNHYKEGLYLLNNLKEVVRAKYKDLRLIIYDLGLEPEEFKDVKELCNCEIRQFQFDKYPEHLKNLKNYAWKPVIIQTVAKEHPFLFWMDASVRFKTQDLDNLFSHAETAGLIVNDMGSGKHIAGSIAERTNSATFEVMHEAPCVYIYHAEKHATFIGLFANQLITKYFLRPWVSCALSFGCMEPMNDSSTLLHCRPVTTHLHNCHRFDQSALGILYVRLFHRELQTHAMNKKYFKFSRIQGMQIP